MQRSPATRRADPSRVPCLRFWAALGLSALAGCGLLPKPRESDLPPLPPYQPGIYADVNPRWSHDGRRIAFMRATPDRRMQLFVVDEELDRPLALLEAELLCPDRPYSPDLQRYCSPDTLAWSPDDRSIAFERTEWFTFEDNGDRLPGTSLWAIDTTSGRVTPLALHPTRYLSLFYYYHDPEWSPDGRYLSFVAEGINGQRCVCLRPLAAEKAQEVRPRFDNYEDSDWPTWAPTGNVHDKDRQPRLVFRQRIQRTFSIPPVETLRRITPGDAGKNPSGEIWRLNERGYRGTVPTSAYPDRAVVLRTGHFAWSADGERLAFTLTPDPNDYSRYELWTMRRDGRDARRVTRSAKQGFLAPVWIDSRRLGALSPTGDRFAVVSIELGSGAVRTLGEIGSSDCDWSPDRSRIVWAEPAVDTPQNPDNPTSLRLFQTGLRGQP